MLVRIRADRYINADKIVQARQREQDVVEIELDGIDCAIEIHRDYWPDVKEAMAPIVPAHPGHQVLSVGFGLGDEYFLCRMPVLAWRIEKDEHGSLKDRAVPIAADSLPTHWAVRAPDGSVTTRLGSSYDSEDDWKAAAVARIEANRKKSA